MANTLSYPKAAAKKDDLILGTSMPLPNTNEDPRTVNFSIAQINGLANSPDIATKTILITTTQLEALGTTDVTLLTLAGGTGDGEYLQLISASILPGGGALGSSYTWDAAGAFISWSDAATNNKIIIPQLQLPDGGGVIQGSYTIAASDGEYRRGADLKLGTAADPIITGTPNGTLTINLTYRIFPQS
jgi:hypothetical protein